MPRLKPDDLSEITPELVGDLNRETLEKLALQVVDLALHLADRLNMNSANSWCPPSSDDPYRRQADREKAAAGKRRGMRGHWRSQAIVVTGEVDHDPGCCGACRLPLGPAGG
jgi:hypothetical protein